jgi:hypothetical protein
MAFQMCDIGVGAGRVDDKVQPLGMPRDHQVVQQPARIIGEERVALPPFGKADHVHRHQRLQRLGRARGQHHLPHMRDIEKPRLLPAPEVFGHDAGPVAHRHLPACEGHETAPELLVQRAQRQVFQLVRPVHVTPSSGALSNRRGPAS